MQSKKITKKKAIDLLAYALLLQSSDNNNDTVSAKQFEEIIKVAQDVFNNNEDKAIKFIEKRIEKMLKDLDFDSKEDKDE